MSSFRDANSPGCWLNYDKELEKEREQLRKIYEEKEKQAEKEKGSKT